MKTRARVRKEIRALASVYLIKDMFVRENFHILREAVSEYGRTEDNELKEGLKYNFQFTLVNAAKIVKGTAYLKSDDNEAAIFDQFLTILKMWENNMFGDAAHKLIMNKQNQLRLPEEPPLEKDIVKIREFTLSVINSNPDLFGEKEYIQLRNSSTKHRARASRVIHSEPE